MHVPLSNGGYTIIDDEDAVIIGSWRWRKFAYRYPGRGIRPGGRYGKQGVIYLHRAITGAGVGEQVDHINGDPLDNRRCNLRIVTHRQNVWNRGKTGGQSTYKGVTRERRNGYWVASIKANGVKYALGTFLTEEMAAAAYNGAAIVLHGQYARLNPVHARHGTTKPIASTPALKPSDEMTTSR